MSDDTATDVAATDEAPVPVTQIKIQGFLVNVAQPHKEGDVLSAAHAQALNQTRSENIRNNAANWIIRQRKTLNDARAVQGLPALADDATLPDEVIADFYKWAAEYDASYDFSVKRTRQPVDPVAREAHKIASAKVREALASKKIDLKELPDGKFEFLVKTLLEKQPAIREIAERRVAEAKAIGSATLADLGL